MGDSKKQLRGRAPLTILRGANGVHMHVYATQLVDPAVGDGDEVKRLVDEGFLEWVVRDASGWKRAEDSDAGSAGDMVTVASAAISDPDQEPSARATDPGLVNAGAHRAAGTRGRSDAEQDTGKDDGEKTARRPGRPSNAEKAERDKAEKADLVEQAVKAGMDRGEAEKASAADLKAALNRS